MYDPFGLMPQITQEDPMVDPYAPKTDFGRVSMGQPASLPEQTAIDEQAETANVMNQANIDAAGDIGATVQAEQVVDPMAYQYTAQGADDTQALGEGMFAFGLSMLAASSKPGANFGASVAQGLAAGSSAFGGALNRNKRFENIGTLEKKGYTQESINAYIESGDNKSLVKGADGKADWSMNSDGYLVNKLTGEVKQGYQKPTADDWSAPNSDGWSINKRTGEAKQLYTPAKGGSGGSGGSGGGSGRKGSGSVDPNDIRVITTPDGVKLGHAYSHTDKETGITTWHDAGTGDTLEVPKGSSFQKDPDYTSAVSKTKENFATAQEFGVSMNNTTKNIKTLLDSGANPYDLSRLVPRTASSEDVNTFANARSNLMMGNYKSMPGIAGMSAATEKTMLDTIPNETASPDVKIAWAKPLVQSHIDYLENYIEQQSEFGTKVPGSVQRSLDEMKKLQAELNSYQAGGKPAKSKLVRAPSSNVATPSNAYAGAAQAQEKPKSFSNLW